MGICLTVPAMDKNRRLANKVRELPENPPHPSPGVSGAFSATPRELKIFRRSQPDFGPTALMHPFVLAVCLLGRGGVIVGEGRFHLLPGQGLLVFPDQAHHYGPFRSEPISWLFISFELPDEDAVLPLRDIPFAFSPVAWERLERLVDCYRALTEGKSALGAEAVEWLSLLLSEILRGAGEPGGRGTVGLAHGAEWQGDIVRSVSRYVHHNLKEPISVADVARHLALSESHVRRLFRRDLGVSLGEFIRRTKIHRAFALLQKSDLNITEVASACGFSSLFAFSRAFRKRTGVSPSAYRRRARQVSNGSGRFAGVRPTPADHRASHRGRAVS